MNKKGFIGELITTIIVGFIVVLFFAGWMYGSDLLNTELTGIYGDTEATNISYIASQNYGYYNLGLQQLTTIAALLLISFMIATLFIAYYSASHPLLFFVYILMAAILIVFSVYVQNAYEEVQLNDVLGTQIAKFTIANHIMTHLTLYMTGITFAGIVLAIVGGMMSRWNP